jgi:RimJ/RimL family protein N-acetyltransferase
MSKGRVIAETERLIIREMTTDDAAFVLELINTPKFHKYIADRGVRTVQQAELYIQERFSANYERNGFGMLAVCLHDGTPVGNCGFVRRDTLPGPDIGFAFLPEYEGNGYAVEAARAMMQWGKEQPGFTDVYAITTPDNAASIRLLEKLGLTLQNTVEVDGEKLNLFHVDLHSPKS